MNSKNGYLQFLQGFEASLREEEKSSITIDKYLRDVKKFLFFSDGRRISKELIIAYKNDLHVKYAAASVNSMLAALNCFLRFIGRHDCCVKLLKIQRQMFLPEERELSRKEYQRLVKAAAGSRLSVIIQTICGTGIRVSELRYITVEAVCAGKSVVNCKNKTRVIFIPTPLCRLLKKYIKKSGVKTGSVFVSRNSRPLDRSNIWREMKALCKNANVSSKKVCPHNLRHLFARTFYSIEKDIVKLADLLGHSSINTTRIYTMDSGYEHIVKLERVQMLLTT